MDDNKCFQEFKTWEANKTKNLIKHIINDISVKYNILYSELEEKYLTPIENFINIPNKVEFTFKQSNVVPDEPPCNKIDPNKCNGLTKGKTQCTRRQKHDKFCETHKNNLKYGTIDDIIDNNVYKNNKDIKDNKDKEQSPSSPINKKDIQYYSISLDNGLEYVMDDNRNVYHKNDYDNIIGVVLENDTINLYQ